MTASTRARAARALGFSLLALAAMPVAARGQVGDSAEVVVDSVAVVPEADADTATVPADTVLPLSPQGALIRSMILPGWGQAEFGAYTRGGVYFGGWAANWFMIFRTQVRLDEARDRYDQRVATLRADLIAAAPDPDSMRAVLDTVPSILDQAIAADDGEGNTAASLEGLVDSREQQREDWIAWSLFWVLASGIDAFVNAHLADFPAAIEMEPGPRQSVSFRLRVPLPGGPP